MIIKYVIPLDRYHVDSLLPAEGVRQRLKAATQAELPLVHMPGDAAPWQGRISQNRFTLRSATKSAARGRGYSAIVNVGRIDSRGSGSRIVVWQRFSVAHMVMIPLAIGVTLTLTAPDFGNPMAFLPAGGLWLMIIIAFQISSAGQKSALKAMVTAED